MDGRGEGYGKDREDVDGEKRRRVRERGKKKEGMRTIQPCQDCDRESENGESYHQES